MDLALLKDTHLHQPSIADDARRRDGLVRNFHIISPIYIKLIQ